MQISHVGLRVRDLAASKRFYAALGFTEALHLEVPDDYAGPLLHLDAPIGFEASYLTNGSFTLQLLTMASHPAPDDHERSMVEAGLTHLSILVTDVASAVEAVKAAGGTAPYGFGGGVACLVRDPDGQLVELLDEKVRPLRP